MLAYEADRRPAQCYQPRAAERALRSGVEEFLMTWRTERCATGVSHFTLAQRALPPELQGVEQAARAEGRLIVASDDGALVTCYRRADAWRRTHRKGELRPGRRSGRA